MVLLFDFPQHFIFFYYYLFIFLVCIMHLEEVCQSSRFKGFMLVGITIVAKLPNFV